MDPQLAVIGLGTMGANLARNAARNGAKVAVFNRSEEKTDEFMSEYGKEGMIEGYKSYKELVQALTPPRPILIMVKAGEAVDEVIDELREHLSPCDILIDGGNSHPSDTQRRYEHLKKSGLKFIGMGVSGGEEGALNGSSMMVGGDPDAYDEVDELLNRMAADDGLEGKCVSLLGPGGAGHFVKMVHNGIEYGVMQLIAESFDLLKRVGGFSNDQLAETFEAWRDSDELSSFLLEITAEIFSSKSDVLDAIKDQAGQKGTGKWTTQSALDYGVAIPTINASVDARIISGSESERKSGQNFPISLDEQDPVPPPMKFRSIVRHAYELSMSLAYMQGILLIKKANEDEKWGIDMGEVVRIWRGGCIIRSSILGRFQNAFGKDEGKVKAGKQAIMERFQGDRQMDWRRTMVFASSRGVPVPAMSASLNYWDALRSENLPQNLIQAQRDFFGNHGFELKDKEGEFHLDG